MTERENFEANREALARSAAQTGPRAHRYEAAFRQYLAAVAYKGRHGASAPEPVSDDQLQQAEPPRERPWELEGAVVGDVMTREVVSVHAGAGFREIVDTLTEHRISAVPVVDVDNRVVGIVSESDLLAKVVTGGDPRARIHGAWRARTATRQKSQADTASELMSAPAVTTTPDTSVVSAARTAAAELVRRLPVVDGAGTLVGMVTRSDLLRVFDRSDEELEAHIIEDIVRRDLCINPSAVRVTVEGGVVTLVGELESKSLVTQMVNRVRSTIGVVSVRDELRYPRDRAEQQPLVGPFY